MNTEDIKRVGGLVDVNLEDLKQKKQKRIIGRLVFYLVQVFFFLFSSLLGYLFVLWEHADPTAYPYGIGPRQTFGGFFTLLGLIGANATISYYYRKKSKLRYIEMIPVQIVIMIISLIGYSFISGLFYQPEVFAGTPLYGVYKKYQ